MAFILNAIDRKKYFSQLKAILLNRHKQNHTVYQQYGQVFSDQTAERFGRYIRAARVNAGLSQQTLAQQTGLSQATITAIEQGLFITDDIQQQWLMLLSQALNEDISLLNLLLNRSPLETASPVTHSSLGKVRQALSVMLNPRFKIPARPAYAALGSTLLLCIVASVMLFTGNLYLKETPAPYKPRTTLINVSTSDRLNMVKAEIKLEIYQQEVSASLPEKLLLIDSQYAPVEFSTNAYIVQPFAGVY